MNIGWRWPILNVLRPFDAMTTGLSWASHILGAMNAYRIIESGHKTQLGPITEAETMADMFEPVELILQSEPVLSLDLEKLDPVSGKWRQMCTIVPETESISSGE